MSWAAHHQNSEYYAALAAEAVAADDPVCFRELYGLAALEEQSAYAGLSPSKVNDQGQTAVRTVLLWLNAGNRQNAQDFGAKALAARGLPSTAAIQIRAMLLGDEVLLADRDSSVLGATPSKPQLTSLTLNSNCSGVGLNDVNNATVLQFMTPANIVARWTAMASDALLPVVLSEDVGNAVVTFKAGLTVSYRATGGNNYIVLMSGNIVDSGTTYPFTGTLLYNSTLSVRNG